VHFHIRNEHRKQPTGDIGHFGTPYSSNRLIKNGSWPRPLKNDVGVWRYDIRESENSGEQTEVSDFSLSVFYFICGTIFTFSVPHTLSLMIYLLTAAHRSNDKYRKMRLDSLSRTSCTHDVRPSITHNVTRNVIDVASHSKDKLRHATNRASVARAATSMTLSTSRRDVVWPIDS
jgi:hypothetical protein